MGTDTSEVAEVKAPTNTKVSRQTLIEGAVGVALLVLAFSAIAISDVSAAGAHTYWVVLVVLFWGVAFTTDRIYSSHEMTDTRSVFAILLHWFGVFCAIQLVYYFVASGRMANADTGLANGIVLALGAFLAGVHLNWRFLILGAAIGAAAAGVAFVEEYLWILLGIAILAIVSLLLGTRLTKARKAG